MTTCTVEPCHPAKRETVQLAAMFLHVREVSTTLGDDDRVGAQ